MNRRRALILAVSASVVVAFAAAAYRTNSPPPFEPSFLQADASAEETNPASGDPAPVPEPAALGLFGIGISTLLTFRRLRKLFN